MTRFLGGNSHIVSLSRGYKQNAGGGSEFRFVPFGTGQQETRRFSRLTDGHTVFSIPSYSKRLKQHSGKDYFDPSDTWALCLGGTASRLARNRVWIDSAPSGLNDEKKRPITRAVLDEMILSDQKWIKAFLLHLRETGVRFLFVSTPPLKADHPALKRANAGRRLPTKVAELLNARSRELLESWLRSESIPYVLPPSAVFDENGLLKMEYSQNVDKRGRRDPHHGNEEYGKLMMDLVEKKMDSLGL